MFCQSCGAPIDPNVRFCPRCGAAANTARAMPQPPPQPSPVPPVYAPPVQYATPPQYQQPFPPGGMVGRVPSYMPQAVLVTLLCCLPFGIVAMVKASQVNSKLAIGDWQGAMQSSASAKTWCWAGFGFGLVATLIWGAALLAGA